MLRGVDRRTARRVREPTIAIAWRAQQRAIAAEVKRQRRIDDLAQQRRVIVVGERDDRIREAFRRVRTSTASSRSAACGFVYI